MEKVMGNRALGKGLSALIPEIAAVNKEEVAFLKTVLVKDNSFQPRKDYNDEKLDELKTSIKENGVLQPILVRKKDGVFEVIAGERRLRAVRDLGIEKIPVIVKDVTDQQALVISLIENIQREELNPIEEAGAYKKLIEEFNYTQDAVARSVGKDRSTVSNLLRLLKLPMEIQKKVSAGALSVGHARALLSVENVYDKKHLVELTIQKGLSVREMEKMVKSFEKGGERLKLPEGKNPPEIISLKESLQKILGTKIDIKHRKKKGKIVIEYYSLKDLDRVIRLITKGTLHD